MSAKVFISCGQEDARERQIAEEVRAWFQGNGYDPYVAIQTQSLADVNSGIIGKLKEADYYVFIDFKRERLDAFRWWPLAKRSRGSLYTHQELAVAYVMGFGQGDAIFLRERGVELNGIATYVMSNSVPFSSPNEVCRKVVHLVNQRHWTPAYSRHLLVSGLVQNPPMGYGYQIFQQVRMEHIWHCQIRNNRSDIGAPNTLARLSEVRDSNGNVIQLHDKSRLKWAYQSGYVADILPGDTEKFDAFALDQQNPSRLYLHSTLDLHPQTPILNAPGAYRLRYQVFSQQFPLLEFIVEITLTGNIATTTVNLV